MPLELEPSYNKFSYLLRPSKQVERKMIVEVLHRMSEQGFSLSEYTYVGMGSPYYADFILFHKYLYIDEMICVEHDPIPKRMDFNKPYQFIRLEMGEISDVLPKLRRNRKYLVWLDYDYVLNQNVLEDTALLLSLLPADSIFLVTVNSDPRAVRHLSPDVKEDKAKLESAASDLQALIGRFLADKVTHKRLTRKRLPELFAEGLRVHFTEEIERRSDGNFAFVQLFNYRYSDGVQMLTVGGAVMSKARGESLSQSSLAQASCVNIDDTPAEISVPPLTIRERLWLDGNMNAQQSNVPFELDSDMLTNFRKYYRYYPSYFETLL